MLKDFYDDDLNYDQEPQVFMGIKIYPVIFKDRGSFYKNINVLLMKKNRIKDPVIIGMSYLEFLDKLFLEELQYQKTRNFYDAFINLLTLTLKEQVFSLSVENQKPILIVDDKKVYGSQFDDIRECILFQNMIEFDDYMSEEFEKEIAEAQRLSIMKNGQGSTLNERKVAYHCATGINYKEINELSLFLFNKGIDRLNIIKEYDVMTYPILKSGGKNITHWCSHIKESKWYDSLITGLDDIQGQVE